ncbi:MAG: hypothetical protein WC869_08185 [Phycisphaerae bacterium]|jgi:hypothetical protein
MNAKTPVLLRVPDRLLAEIDAEAGLEGISRQRYILSCVRSALRHGEKVYLFREFVVTPRGSSTVDSFLEFLLSRRPVLSDMTDGAIEPQAATARAMKKVLSPEQYRRFVAVVFHGRALVDVGREAGVSKQAIHRGLQRSIERLGCSRRFAQALCDQFPDAGLDPDKLMIACRERRLQDGTTQEARE